MAYCTQSDIEKVEPSAQVVQLTDDAGTGSVNTSNLFDAIKSADALIDTYLRGHVSVVPVSPVPDIIVKISVEISICNLYLRKYGAAIPDGIQKRQAWAEGKLKEIVAGTIVISDEQKAEEAHGSVKVKAPDQMFSHDVLDTF